LAAPSAASCSLLGASQADLADEKLKCQALNGLAKKFIFPSLDNFIPEAHLGIVAALPLEGAH